jgi:LysM repeat protein
MSKLGKVNLYIDTEQLSNSVTATAYPVDKGEPISDHVQQQPQTLSLTGKIIKTHYKPDLQYLRDCMRKGTLLTYTGRTVAKKVIIISIDDSRTGDLANGSSLSIQLQFIKIVKEKWSSTSAKAKTAKKTVGKKKKTVNKKSSAKYIKVKKGMTYWALSRQYGTSISQLESWNKYPARKIPVGVRLRVA